MSGTKVSTEQGAEKVQMVAQGPVMPIGGAENKDGNSDILTRFVELAGGSSARIVLIPSASEGPEDAARMYTKAFDELGVNDVSVLDIADREDANSESALETLASATGIFISGGAQSRLVDLLVGTKAMECIRQRNADGIVVAGTSAGASVLASHMMLGGTGEAGNSSEAAARKHMVEMVAGLGLLQDVIVDQHFSERGRMGRLLSIYAANPGLLCVGLDQDTAVVIDGDGCLQALGTGMVTIVDGRDARSDYFEREEGEVLTVADSHLSVLGPDRRFDLRQRRVVME